MKRGFTQRPIDTCDFELRSFNSRELGEVKSDCFEKPLAARDNFGSKLAAQDLNPNTRAQHGFMPRLQRGSFNSGIKKTRYRGQSRTRDFQLRRPIGEQ